MSPAKLILAFLPLIAYSAIVSVGGAHTVPSAALISLALVAGIVAVSLIRGATPKLLNITTGGVFALYLAVAIAAPGTTEFLASYGRALAPIVVAAVVFALLPVMPFTEQFARESVPQEFWNDPHFHALNRRLSAVWGGVIGAVGVGHAVQEALPADRPGIGAIFGWALPFVLFLIALRYTKKASQQPHPAHEAVAAVH
jgi:hypothetical protein